MKRILKRMAAGVLALSMTAALTACGNGKDSGGSASGENAAGASVYTIGICNYVDHASLNQIVDNIQSQLKKLEAEHNITFEVKYQNAAGDANVTNQIIDTFMADEVDLMIGVATPVAIAMQTKTEDTDIPVVFSAVSDPVGAGLAESMEAPGANITGTSDFLDTNKIMELIRAQNPSAKKIGLLYDQGQDSSTAPIKDAKKYMDENGIDYVERTGTTNDEVKLAAKSLIADKVDAIFTPTDNTIMTAELSIYEDLIEAGIPHYTGADSFALNGAFVSYGVDYANLGVETANMAADILVNGKKPAELPVKTFENGIATINTETCEALGLDFDKVEAAFKPLCTAIVKITTAEGFDALG